MAREIQIGDRWVGDGHPCFAIDGEKKVYESELPIRSKLRRVG